jgi:hypothetical protein
MYASGNGSTTGEGGHVMKKISSFLLVCVIALLTGLALASCTTGPLPDRGLKHAVSALDRALLGNAFVAETARADDCNPEFGLFTGEQLAFMHAYPENCQAGDALGFPMGIWPEASVKTGSCGSPYKFTLDVYSDKDLNNRIAAVLVTAQTLPGGTRAVRTQSTLLDREEDDNGPLDVSSVYDLTTEIGPDNRLLKRTMGENTRLVFDMDFGERFFLEYGEGSSVIFNAPECPAGAGLGMLITEATVRGGASGLGPARVTPSEPGLICFPPDHDGGPVPGRFDVEMDGVTTNVEYEIGPDGNTRSFRASNTIGGTSTETYCVAGKGDVSGDPELIEADFFIGSRWIVAEGLGDMSLHLDLNFEEQDSPRSLLRFETFPNAAFPASWQEEPSLLGLLLMVKDNDDWCTGDEDGDGILNCEDPCPHDVNPGCQNWCDLDEDGDGILNCMDYCPNDSDPCDDPWCYLDDDKDGRPNCLDECPANADPDCSWCDLDKDGDGTPNCKDPCPDDAEDLCL